MRNQKGIALFAALAMMMLLSVAIVSGLWVINSEYRLISERGRRMQARYVAEAALVRACARIQSGDVGNFSITEQGVTANVTVSPPGVQPTLPLSRRVSATVSYNLP
ncbi:MAG: hypothetical protein JW937_10630 [Candidatus Omnitrophica bacterium]|nr:hypothetical protein [Candidatus Omnitrophota bacterium]